MSAWQILLQNFGNGGWFETVSEIALAPNPVVDTDDAFIPRNTSDLAFHDSQNALEDVFGLLAGLVMARVDGSLLQSSGSVTSQYYRVGGGHAFGIIYAVPNIVCSLVLLWLLLNERSEQKRRPDTGESGYSIEGGTLRLDDLTDILDLERLILRRAETMRRENVTSTD